MSPSFPPPLLAHTTELDATLQTRGYAVLNASQVAELSATALPQLLDWCRHWNDLPADAYLRDGGRYRRRRHSCFVVRGEQLQQVPHRAHWQPLAYNALHGGLERHFEPMSADWVKQAQWRQLLVWLGRVCSQRKGQQPWFIEAHQFRIDTTDGIGRPTPEGAHRDGVDMVAVFLVARHGVKGGETRVFEADGPNGQRFTLCQPWSVLLLDDARVIHESTPIQPLEPLGSLALPGYRDTLVITLRAGGFQAAA